MRKQHVTSRDAEMLNELEELNLIMTADQIARMYYFQTKNEVSAINTARRRLTTLVELKQIKRVRDYQNQSYIYYMSQKVPGKTSHRLLISEFLVTLKLNGFELIDVKVEFTKLENEYSLQPDIYCLVEYNGSEHLLLVECDITKKFTNSMKYINIKEGYLYEEQLYKEFGSYQPTDESGDTYNQGIVLHDILKHDPVVVSVCDRKPEEVTYKIGEKSKSFKPVWIKTDMSNINNLINTLPIKWKG